MVPFSGLTDAVLTFVTQYGYVALFVYMLLETSFILHFVPSELVVPFAAAVLVKGPVTFGLFVLDATAGATVGSLLAYYVFGRYGESALRRYGRYIHLTERDLARGQRWFTRWGESSVLWGRLLPVVRALISVPAGIAEMNLRKFTLYSAAGALVFNTVLTYIAYTGAKIGVGHLVGGFSAGLGAFTASARLFVPMFAVSLVGCSLAGVVWRYRAWILAHPNAANRRVWWTVRVGGAGLSLVFVGSAIGVPQATFALAAWLWDDLVFAAELGASPRFSLLVTGLSVLVGAFVLSAIGTRLPIDRLAATMELM